MAIIKTDEFGQFHEYGIYTPARIIECMGDIDEEKATEFVKNIRLLDHANDKDIIVMIATEGGDVHWGMAMFDAIKECNSKVTTHAVGPCWSMGSVILQAGDVRKISANATVMIHTGTDSYSEGHPKLNKKWMKENDRVEEVTVDILHKKIKEKKPRFSRQKLRDILVFDTIFTADECVTMGLADMIEDHKEF